MKKLVMMLCLFTAMILLPCIMVSAAGLQGPAKDIADELNRLHKKYPNLNLEKSIDDATIWLASASITQEEAASIISNLRAAETTAGNARNFEDLSTSQQRSILTYITAAADVVDIKVEVNAGDKQMKLTYPDGSESILDLKVIEQMGIDADFSVLIIFAAGVSVLLATGIITVICITKSLKKRRYRATGYAFK